MKIKVSYIVSIYMCRCHHEANGTVAEEDILTRTEFLQIARPGLSADLAVQVIRCQDKERHP